MEKTKLLTIAVFALLLLNLGTLGFLVLGKPSGREPRGPHQEPKFQIIEKLQFDEPQQEQYENLIVWHRTTIDGIDEHIRMAKNRLYLQLLKDKTDNQTKDSLIEVIVNYQKQIEQAHFTHFQDIKKICRPNQLKNYYELTAELSRIFSKPPRPRHD